MKKEKLTSNVLRIGMQIDPEIYLPYHNLKSKQQIIPLRQNHFISTGIAYSNLKQFKEHFPYLLILTNDMQDLEHRDLQMDEMLLEKDNYINIKGGFGDDYRFYKDVKSFNNENVKNIIIDCSTSSYLDLTDVFLTEGPEPVSYRFMFSTSKIEKEIIAKIIENTNNEIEFIDNSLNYVDCIVYNIGHNIFYFETKNDSLIKVLVTRYKKRTDGPFSDTK